MRHFETGSARRVVGLALLLGMLSCGGQAASESADPEPFAGAARPVPPPPASSSPSPPRSVPPSATPAAPPSAGMRPIPPRGNDECNCAQESVQNVLLSNCGQCHGPVSGAGSGAINFIGDMDELAERGLIVPLSSASSRIILVMRDGSMPPRSSGLPPVIEADIETVAFYIDQPRFWPNAVLPSAADAGVEAPLSDAGRDGG